MATMLYLRSPSTRIMMAWYTECMILDPIPDSKKQWSLVQITLSKYFFRLIEVLFSNNFIEWFR